MNRFMHQLTHKRIPAAIFAVVILLTSMIIPNTTADAAGSLNEHLAIGYWLGGNGGSNKTLLQADEGWDVINVSFIETKGTYYTPHLNMDLKVVYPGSEADQIAAFKADIKALQAMGKKVVISCGGQNGVVHFDTPGQRDIFLNGVIDIIREYGFDGFDVDFEGSSIAVMNPDKIGNLVTAQSINLNYILHELKDEFGEDFIISAAPEYCYVQGGAISTGNFGAFLPVLDACRDILTYIHPQYYNGFDGDFSWLQPSANAGAPFAHVYSAEGYRRLSEMLITGFVTQDKGTFVGLRPDQVAFGVPSRDGAGAGAQSPAVYAQALQDLIDEYPTFRGIMTWSLGWDETGNDIFIDAIAPVIAANNQNGGNNNNNQTNAQAPAITGQPADQAVDVNEDASLTVVAAATGNLSYQWYTTGARVNHGGTALSGATAATFSAPTDTVGTAYYYCVVTNTDNSATGNTTASTASNVAAVTVTSVSPVVVNAQTPVINTQPADKTVVVNAAANLTVNASVTGGNLSYQWYSVATKVNNNGTAINGATAASYAAPTDASGVSYYYCVITNTDNTVNGNNTAAITSNAVAVTVNEPATGDTWDATAIYTGGEVVVYQGQTYVCKWWTQGDLPSAGGAWELQSSNGNNEYVPGNAYSMGAIVEYQGQTWCANWWTNTVPGSDSSWRLV